ncbi:MAG: DUF4358 domain-containing protein [Christensenellaceae bacterium]|jgi:hypothetical protein|nr:DUF4358 domain-containing protein [Christensenellaceae bacterium]
MIKRNRFALFACLLALCLALGACGAPAPTQPEDAAALLDAIVESAGAKLGEEDPLPKTVTDAILAESSQGMLGIGESDFSQYVDAAFASNALISSHAHEVALVKCKDAAAAEKVKGLIAAGFDPLKWICVRPETCNVVVSGKYVLLTATNEKIGSALIEAFKEQSGAPLGEIDSFFNAADAGESAGTGGGLILN